MAIAVACHVEPAVESGVMSVVVTCQSMMEPYGIRYKKWSRVVDITVACQGVQARRPKLGWGVWWRGVALRLRRARMLLASLLPLGALGASTAGEGHLL